MLTNRFPERYTKQSGQSCLYESHTRHHFHAQNLTRAASIRYLVGFERVTNFYKGSTLEENFTHYHRIHRTVDHRGACAAASYRSRQLQGAISAPGGAHIRTPCRRRRGSLEHPGGANPAPDDRLPTLCLDFQITRSDPRTLLRKACVSLLLAPNYKIQNPVMPRGLYAAG